MPKMSYSAPLFVFVALNVTSLSGSGYGSGRSRTVSTTLNIATFAPIPSASVRMATMAKAGAFDSDRRAWRNSATTAVICTSSTVAARREAGYLPAMIRSSRRLRSSNGMLLLLSIVIHPL
jgi:hypothetical protein